MFARLLMSSNYTCYSIEYIFYELLLEYCFFLQFIAGDHVCTILAAIDNTWSNIPLCLRELLFRSITFFLRHPLLQMEAP